MSHKHYDPNEYELAVFQGRADEVDSIILQHVLNGWKVYAQTGFARFGCGHDEIRVQLVRALRKATGPMIDPDNITQRID